MAHFGEVSESRLRQAHPLLQLVFRRVIQGFDCAILEAHRDEAAQARAFEKGASHLAWPDSKHNRLPALAVDVAPWVPGHGIDWEATELWRAFGGYALGVGTVLGVPLRWGGDWDGDWDFKDQRLHDLPHFELLGSWPVERRGGDGGA